MNDAKNKAKTLFDLWIEKPELVEQNLGKARLVIDNYKKFKGQAGYEEAIPILLETFIFKKYDFVN